MRRGFVALLLAATFFAACSSFDGDSEPRTPAPDAEADTSVPPDRGDGGPSDAGPDARGLSFCVQRPDALFCDDFEQPNRTFTTAEPWDALSGNRANVMSIGRPGFASPSALRIKGALGDGEGRGLQKILPLDGRKIRWSFRLLVARLDQRADAGAPQVSIAAFQFANDKYLVYALFRHAGDLRGIAAWNLTGDAGPAL